MALPFWWLHLKPSCLCVQICMYLCKSKTSNNEAPCNYFRPNHIKPRQRSKATSLCCFLSNSSAFLEIVSQGQFTQPGCLSQLEMGGVEVIDAIPLQSGQQAITMEGAQAGEATPLSPTFFHIFPKSSLLSCSLHYNVPRFCPTT